MNTPSDRLEFWKQVAQIVSALAIPVVLALIGFYVQRSLADSGLKKDYVQMALSVLSNPPSGENEQLRQWAIAVLDKNSPVSLPPALKSQLVVSKFVDFSPSALKFEQTVVCKPVPNPETLEWLIATEPTRYTRCSNGQVGVRTWKLPNFLKESIEAEPSATK